MISVIIPTYINNEEKYQLLSECVASLVGADEIIIQFDLKGEGFSRTVNKGVARSHGEYIAIINDDTRMLEGSLVDFCIPNTIVRPRVFVGAKAKFSFVVMPREAWDKIGGLCEDFIIGGCEDSWFMFLARKKGIAKIHSSLKVWHKGSASLTGIRTPELDKKNQELCTKKMEDYKD
jgi:GT2 family glycosyltransferase